MISVIHVGTNQLYLEDVSTYLDSISSDVMFDLVVTSPPYNIGKSYEKSMTFENYIQWQGDIIHKIIPHIKETGSVCWQVGNYVNNGAIWPIDIEIAPIFRNAGFQLRNRIIWRVGHGLHAKRRFSGRYEVILWFTKSDDYIFNLDPVRIPSKYPDKKYYQGPRKGEYSCNPLGKNPEDVWDIPNVKNNHVEKTIHPCQFPVGLVERLVLSMTNEGDLVFDPFAGVCSYGVAALIHKRRFIGCDINLEFLNVGRERLEKVLNGEIKYRPHNKPIYDPSK